MEGSEWDGLAALVESPEDIKKIRTLDMEVHFGFGKNRQKAESGTAEEGIAWEVEIFEKLLKSFASTGNTLEVYRQGWTPVVDCGKEGGRCEEPLLHLKNGMNVAQFAISYVNRDLLLG